MALVYNSAKTLIANGDLDLLNDTLKVMLVDDSYTADADHDFVSEANAAELDGTGYTGGFGGSGRLTLTSKSVVEVDASDRAEFRVGDPSTWNSIDAGTAAGAIIVREGTSDADSDLIAYVDSGGFPVTTNGGDFTINWSAAGVLQFT